MAGSEAIIRAAILKESKTSLHSELLDSEGEGNFCVVSSFLFEERSITVVPFCLQF